VHGDVLDTSSLNRLHRRVVDGNIPDRGEEHGARKYGEYGTQRRQGNPRRRFVSQEAYPLSKKDSDGYEHKDHEEHAVEQELYEKLVRCFADNAAGPGAVVVHAADAAT